MTKSTDNRRFWGFKESWEYIREAFTAQYCQVVPIVYFVIVVLLFGGFGLWESLYGLKMHEGVMACNTIALSVGSAACVDLLFSRNNLPLRALGLVLFVAVCGFHLLAVLSKGIVLISGILAFLAWFVAHFTWWVVNVHNPNLIEPVDPSDSSGGSTCRRLAGYGKNKGLRV